MSVLRYIVLVAILFLGMWRPAASQAVSVPGVASGMGYGLYNYTDDNAGWLSPKTFRRRALLKRASRDYHGPYFGSWLINSQLTVGPTFTDNLYFSSTNRRSGFGSRIVPNFTATRDSGIHRTKIYGIGDLSIFPSESKYNLVNASFGFSHLWEARRDLLVKLNGQADRITTVYGINGPSSSLVNGVTAASSGGSGSVVAPTTSIPLFGFSTSTNGQFQRWSVFGGSASILKSFDRLFTGTTVGSFYAQYEPVDIDNTNFYEPIARNDQITYAVNRVGYALTPAIYAYTDNSGNIRNMGSYGVSYYGNLVYSLLNNYNVGVYNTSGFRSVGGLGYDRGGGSGESLWKGEIYAGYQQQYYHDTRSGSTSMPVFGGRLSWRPNPAWAAFVSLDRFYQDFYVPPGTGNQLGSPFRVLSGQLGLSHAFSRTLSASLSQGYFRYAYITGNNTPNTMLSTTATVNYELQRNLSLTFQYQFWTNMTGYNNSSTSLASLYSTNSYNGTWTRNQVTLGLTYKY